MEHEEDRDGQPDAHEAPLDERQDRELSSAFAPPRWLRDLGRTSWALVGAVALLVGIVWLLTQTAVIVGPVIAGLVVATVASPLVGSLERRGVPRVLGALVVLLALLAIALVIVLLVVGGIIAQRGAIADYATAAAAKAESWVESSGVDAEGAERTRANVEIGVSGAIDTLVHGVARAVQGISSIVFALAFTVFSLFFLLKDGPMFRGWVDGHLGVPLPVARTVTGDVIFSLRRYFIGVTIVAAFNGLVVGIGCLLLDVPLAGTIAVVTFVTAYIPFIGAFVSGAFAVVIALGAGGTSTAAIMLVIVLLANGLLQNVVQPLAFGATLELNPLVVLVVTISAGSLFGMTGLILGAPLVSAAVHIVRDVGQLRTTTGLSPPVEVAHAPQVPA